MPTVRAMVNKRRQQRVLVLERAIYHNAQHIHTIIHDMH
jgi:hypothetical protein